MPVRRTPTLLEQAMASASNYWFMPAADAGGAVLLLGLGLAGAQGRLRTSAAGPGVTPGR